MEYKINEVKRSKIYELDANSLRVTRELIRDRELERHAEIARRFFNRFRKARIIPYEILHRQFKLF